ncbi:hypothetical protein PAPHI01_1372 [Pancytospora philotis]|nr:hypothetical protein PAPHI01_1372 [Pancytospora philotis]
MSADYAGAGEKENAEPNSSRRSIQQTVIPDNPFDIFNGGAPTRTVVRSREAAPKSDRKDDDFISILKRSDGGGSAEKAAGRNGIFRELRILSKHEMSIAPRKYYRFPHGGSVKNDESEVFADLYRDITTALTSAYLNYRRFGEKFKVLFEGELISFEDAVHASAELERVFRQNDVAYKRLGDALAVESEDAALVCDLIINSDVAPGAQMPFILSAHEFENATVYHTRVEKGPIVSVGTKKEHLYFVHGPLDSSDYPFEPGVEVSYVS